MFEHASSVISFPDIAHRSSALRHRHPVRTGRSPYANRLDLRTFVRLLQDEGLSDRLPDLELHIRRLSDYHRSVFGFTFDPAAIRIPNRDLAWMLLGLREGILTRGIVIDSPRAMDVVRLGLDPTCSMLRYRFEQLVRSGIHFISPCATWSLWNDLRWPKHGSLAERVTRVGGAPSASYTDLMAVYESLPSPPTIGGRVGIGPRLLLVGRNREPRLNRVLAARSNGEPVVKTMFDCRSPAFALEEGCRFLSPEGALLLLASPDVRDGESSYLAEEGPIWLSGLNPFGMMAKMQSEARGVFVSVGDVRRNDPLDRLPASSE
jgi:hypothetical protein